MLYRQDIADWQDKKTCHVEAEWNTPVVIGSWAWPDCTHIEPDLVFGWRLCR